MLKLAAGFVCFLAAAPAWAVSGVIYDGTTFDPVGGAQVFLIDEATGREVAREVLGPGQQGQRTPITGQYQFDPPAGVYRIDVRAAGFAFPARLGPLGPEPFGEVADQTSQVVSNAVPAKGTSTAYYLRLRSHGGRGELANNHVPVQPAAGLVRFTLAARTPRITSGERAAFVATIENSTRQGFPDRPAGVSLELPEGFKYAPHTLELHDAATGRLLTKQEPANNGVRLEGIVVPANGRYEVRAMVTAGARVTPGKHTFIAHFYAVGDLSELAEPARATLQIEADPMFDRSEIMGRVFCDANENGFFDPGERGLSQTRVYLDNGSYSVADASGKYHFSNVSPGMHLAKVDPDTVPPGSEATRSLRRDFHLTSGLPAKIDFGFKCATEQAQVPKRAAEMPTIDVIGSADPLAITIGGETYVASDVDVSVDGSLPALRFKTRVRGTSPPHYFSLLVRNAKKDIVYRIDGAGVPPAELVTDLTERGKSALEPGQAYTYELAVWTTDAISRSARMPLVVAAQAASLPAEIVLRGELFTSTNKPTPLLISQLGGLRLPPGRIAVDVHVADDGPSDERLAMTEKRAQAVKAVLGGYGVEPQRVIARGHADQQPLGPNLGAKGRERNRRVVIAFEQPTSQPSSAATSAPTGEKLGLVHGVDVQWHGPRFKTTVFPAERSTVFLQREDGRAFGVRTGYAPRGRGKIEVAGGVGSDRVFVDGVAVPLGLASFGCSVQSGVGTLRGGKLVQPMVFAITGGTNDVRFGIYGSGDNLVEVKPVPKGAKTFSYTSEALKPGTYSYRCSARDQVGGQVTTAPELFTLAESTQVETIVRGTLFERRSLGADLKAALDNAVGPLEVEVHGGGDQDAMTEQRSTAGEAAIIQLYLGAKGTAKGMGKSQPLVPPVGRKAVEKNRRIVIKTLVAASPASDEVLPLKAPSPRRVSINGDAVKLDDKGRFAQAVVVAESASEPVLVLNVQNGEGREATYRIALGASSAQSLVGRLPFAGEPPPEQAFLSTDAVVAASRPAVSEAMAGVTLDLPLAGARFKQDYMRGRVRGPVGTRVEVRRVPSAPASQPGSEPASMPTAQPASLANSALASSAPASEPASLASSQPTDVIAQATIGADGEADLDVPLQDGDNPLAFGVTTPSGEQGELQRKYEMSPNRWFLMAMGEASLGQAGAQAMLPETDKESTLQVLNGQAFLHGRAMLYFKGRIKGDYFFKDNRFTVYGDTAGPETSTFWRQVVEPDKFYPVYGDASNEVQDAQSQHKLYVLIEADESKLEAGNVLTQIRGLELFRYDRALFGARLDFDKSFTPSKIEHTKLQAVVGQPLLSSRRVHASMRGTGGSLYFLRDRAVIEGSEQVKIVVRDGVSGSIVQEVAKKRNVDYTIQYDTGRIVFLEAISAYSQGSLAARLTPISATQGDTVNIEVDYEAQDFGLGNQISGGGFLKESVFDGRLTMGGGFVQEHRGADATTPDYKLYGGSLELKPFRGISVSGELNRSEGSDLALSVSTDGGQSFADINKPQTFTDQNGRTQTLTGFGMRASGALDLQKILNFDRELVTVSGYAQRIDPNYFAGISTMEQGQLKFGAAAKGAITSKDFVIARHDGSFSDIPAAQAPTFSLRRVHRELTAAGYEHVESKWDAGVLYYHTFSDDSSTTPNILTDTINLRGSYKILPKLTLFATQEFVLRPDPSYIQRTADQFATEIGARYKITDQLEGQISEIVRYGGSNATQVGLRTPFGQDGRVYINERFSRDIGGWTGTTIVGAENSVARGSKAYGEYQLDSGTYGPHARAVYGLNNRWEVLDGLYVGSTYERMQNTGTNNTGLATGRGTDQGGVPTASPSYTGQGSGLLGRDRAYFAPSAILGLTYPVGIASRDALSVSAEFLRFTFIKLTGRFEVRFDNQDFRLNQRDRLTLFGTLGAAAQLHRDLTFVSRVEIAEASEPETKARIGALQQMTFGLAYRPINHDYFHALLKYTRREFDRPKDLGNGHEHEVLDIISVVPVAEWPLIRTQLVEKVAFKFQQLELDDWDKQKQVAILWINRLNFHILKWLDVGAEYRIKRLTGGAGQTQGGFLGEVSFSPIEYLRVGAGYNFTHFSDDELADDRIDNKGFFVRAVGKY